MTANAWALLHVLFSRVANIWEVFLSSEDWTSKPHCVPLNDILKYITIDLGISTIDFIVRCHSLVNSLLQASLKTLIESCE